MKKHKNQILKKKKIKKILSKSIKKPKKQAISLNEVEKNLTKEEYVNFKIWCIRHKRNVYHQIASLIRKFLKENPEEVRSIWDQK